MYCHVCVIGVLQLTGPNEKTLAVVGDNWDWVQSKRMLATVTEASLEHMKKDIVLGKFASNLSWLPALKNLRLSYNGFDKYDDVSDAYRPPSNPFFSRACHLTS